MNCRKNCFDWRRLPLSAALPSLRPSRVAAALFLSCSVAAFVGPPPATASQETPPPAPANNDNNKQSGSQIPDQARLTKDGSAPELAQKEVFTEGRARSLLAAALVAVKDVASVRMQIGKSLTTWSDHGKLTYTTVDSGVGVLSRSREPDAAPWQARLRCEWEGREGNAPAYHATAAYDGDVLRTYSDVPGEDGERVFEEVMIGPGLMDLRRLCGSCGTFNWAPPTIPITYLNGDFLGAPDADTQVTHLGLAPVGTTVCELVRLEWAVSARAPETPGERYVFHFAIDPETKLPWSMSVVIYQGDRRFHAESFSIKSLELNPTLVDADFSLDPPPGYRTVREDHRGPPVGAATGTWRLRDTQGRTHAREDYDNRVLVLDFWATWCGPCRQVMPQIQFLHDRYKNDPRVAVLGVNCMEKGKSNPTDVMAQVGVSYPTLLEGDVLARVLNVKALPTVAVIGRDRKVLYANVGHTENLAEEVTKVIEAHLAKQGGQD